MFNKYQAVFRSRWRALFWAAGVCLTAYCSVPDQGDEDAAASVVRSVAGHSKAPHKHVNPWAIEDKTH